MRNVSNTLRVYHSYAGPLGGAKLFDSKVGNKMQTHLPTRILLGLLISFLMSCENSSGPSGSGGNFCPLNVGDKLQIVNLADSATQFFTVLGNVKRQDGAQVFAIEEKLGSIYADTVYRFVRDGFLIATQIDSLTWFTQPSNPYAEARIAKVNLADGESWMEVPSSTDTVFITARYLSSLPTLCGAIPNVFALTSGSTPNTQQVGSDAEYYANLFGFVGYDAHYLGIQFQWRASYIKCGTMEMGSPWSAKTQLPLAKES